MVLMGQIILNKRKKLLEFGNSWDCTWVWGKMLNLRPMVHPYILNVLGDGHSTSLWYDNWHPLGPLIAKYGTRIAFDSGIPKDAIVSHIILSSN